MNRAAGGQNLTLASLANTRWHALEVSPAVSTMTASLREAAARWPDRTLFNFFELGVAQTYAEFYDQVRRVAAGLATLGVEPGARVGIQLGNVPEFPVAWFGVIAARAVAVPVNPQLTAKELAFIADDTGMSAFIADSASIEKLADGEALPVPRDRVVSVGAARGAIRSFESLARTTEPMLESFLETAAPMDLVSIQFTSGTTGLPKGCMLTHAYWSIIGMTCSALMGNATRNILADHPFYYMQDQAYLMAALQTGAQIHVSPGLSRSRYLDWLRRFEVDFAWVSDSLMERTEMENDSDHLLRLAPSDVIDPTLHAKFESRFGWRVREWYASTEIGMGIISPWDEDDAVGSGSIGYPAPYREARLVGEDLQDLSAGEIGELCVRGPGMMTGYWNRPEINAELFLDGGWLRTGDLCRTDTRGRYYFVGRAKDMVRRSGENISAMEVETQLLSHPAVAECAVIPLPDQRRGEEVLALIVLDEGAIVSEPELIRWAGEGLARYKVPRFICFQSELPLTPSGKIWKAGLRARVDEFRASAFDTQDQCRDA